MSRSAATGHSDYRSGLVVLPGPFTGANRDLIIAEAIRLHLPAVHPFVTHVRSSGLASYGIDPVIQSTRSAVRRPTWIASSRAQGLMLFSAGCWIPDAVAATVTLSTNDASEVSAFGKPGQGWWSQDTTNILSNTNYSTGTSYNVSPGVNFRYRSFFTFDLDNPAFSGQVITGAELKLQAFQGQFDAGLISFFGATINPFVLNHTVGVATPAIWDGLASGTPYGTFSVQSSTEVLTSDIFTFQLNGAAVADLNNAIGTGFFSIGAAKELNAIFSSSEANGNQQLVLETSPAITPLPAAFPLFATGLGAMGLLGWHKKRKAQTVA